MLRASLYSADQRPLFAALCIMLSLLRFAGQPQLDQEESFVPLGLVRMVAWRAQHTMAAEAVEDASI